MVLLPTHAAKADCGIWSTSPITDCILEGTSYFIFLLFTLVGNGIAGLVGILYSVINIPVYPSGGIAVIDELDKMNPEDRDALHEALEQQRISISKANIQATLRAETTVLAAANPKLGRFDPYAPIASQIDLPPTLINRFDLIFPIRDLPNKELDEKIAGHVLNLQQNPEDIKTEISGQLLRKYLSYAKQKIIPQLSNEAIQEIKDFYIDLRNSGQKGEGEIRPIPISARQLEALVRLAEASARSRLSDKVIRQDAKRAIELLKHCLMQVGFD